MSKQVKFNLIAALRAEGYAVTVDGGRVLAHCHGQLCAWVETAGSGNIEIHGVGCGAALVSRIAKDLV